MNNANETDAESEGQNIAQEFNHSDPDDEKYHLYTITTLICQIGGGCNADLVFEFVANITPPQSICDRSRSSCTGAGNHYLASIVITQCNMGGSCNRIPVDDDPIETWVNTRARVSGNNTRVGHRFHDGQVIHAVYAHQGAIYLHTLGTGTGGARWFNELAGPPPYRANPFRDAQRIWKVIL